MLNLFRAMTIIVQRLPKQLIIQMNPLISHNIGRSRKKLSPLMAPKSAKMSVIITPKSHRAKLTKNTWCICLSSFTNRIRPIAEIEQAVCNKSSFASRFLMIDISIVENVLEPKRTIDIKGSPCVVWVHFSQHW